MGATCPGRRAPVRRGVPGPPVRGSVLRRTTFYDVSDEQVLPIKFYALQNIVEEFPGRVGAIRLGRLVQGRQKGVDALIYDAPAVTGDMALGIWRLE